MAEVNLNDINTTLNNQKTDLQKRMTGFSGLESGFNDKYGGFIKGQEGLPAMYKRIGDELGVPTLRSNAASLNQSLSDIPATYSAATRGFDVNANQLARIVSTKQAALAPAAQKATSQAQSAEDELGRRIGFEQSDQARLEKPLTMEQKFLTDRIARESSGFTHEDDNELQGLLQKLQMGVTLSEGEKNRAQQLSMADKEFEHQKELAKASATSNPYMSVGENSSVFDTRTGTWVSGGGGGGGSNNYNSYFGGGWG